jgi:predicted GH43/DUF377 family glycosyl hydrolase
MLINRLPLKIKNDPKKVILQYFDLVNPERTKRALNRIETFDEKQVDELLKNVLDGFDRRHKNFKESLIENYAKVEKYIENPDKFTENRKLLTGSYFSKEYSIEASALFNPSLIPHPDQSGLKDGEVRFIISLRATGEGHVSSIEFRSGIITKDNQIKLDPVSRYSVLPEIVKEMEYSEEFVKQRVDPNDKEAVKKILNANYDISFDDNSDISERVIFPFSNAELVGMEDVRFVRFTNDDGSIIYYGTYTAYNGLSYKTQIIETENFKDFKIRTLHGNGVKDKGMALFPRKVNGQYAMASREDAESIFVLLSDSLYFWNDAKKIKKPGYDWEVIQTGNCGLPIETEKGWLLITHAVGPMRTYVISACLLDLNDPSKVIGELDKPLLSPTEEEREGYVPNVVYSCGSLVNNGELVIPYAMSDSYCGFAKTTVKELLAELV